MKSITANRLNDGEAVWLDARGAWVTDARRAAVFRSDDEAVAMLETVSRQGDVVVEPYAIDVTVEAGAMVPVRLRERIRAKGPTVRSDLGPQAALAAVAA
ncbi:DUF2849 domain-containing protein [Rhodobium gokarnense]|uniref:DUF2849 domain-containing protein n=1 Tax=Rhodobium gokarnense TaxID=364296 RepID=A0ABT3H8P7_9HYPH|nr:DUF2849 domain-containing protein [Rhodobium gokarnense]MCW2306761.1 hypothetical protein [Rhodobium gokarnense]